MEPPSECFDETQTDLSKPTRSLCGLHQVRCGKSAPVTLMKASSDPVQKRPTVLGVSQSLDARHWCFRASDEGLIRSLQQQYQLDDTLARIIAGRDIGFDQIGPAALDPKLRDLMPNPSSITDMDKAAARFVEAVEAGEQIAIFGDYDVDGATSSSVLVRFCRALGHDPIVHIPDRMTEGYGPNTPALKLLKAKGASVIITVDCGATAYEPLAAARADGLDVLVIDHHAMEASAPEAHAVVNPNRIDEDCREDLRYLAALCTQ